MGTSTKTNLLRAIFLGAACAIGGLNSASAISSLDAINMSNPEMVQWRKLGKCGFMGTLITHRIPLAWTETSPGGPAFITGVPQGQESKSGFLRLSGLDTGSESSVFLFTQSLWMDSQIANSYNQRVCPISSATVPSGGGFGGAASCEAPQQSMDSSDDGSIIVGYDSRRDPGWKSGCRDDAIVKQNMANNLRCFTSNMSPNLMANSSDTQNSCIGNWGSLYPRQGREIGLTGAVASAKTAYRAMSTARDHLGSIPFPVDQAGLMQQSMPTRSPGFSPGQRPISGSQDAANKHYAWIYWRQVICCI